MIYEVEVSEQADSDLRGIFEVPDRDKTMNDIKNGKGLPCRKRHNL